MMVGCTGIILELHVNKDFDVKVTILMEKKIKLQGVKYSVKKILLITRARIM